MGIHVKYRDTHSFTRASRIDTLYPPHTHTYSLSRTHNL